MPRVSVSANFECGPEELFAAVVDWPGHARWQPTLAEVQLDQPLALGATLVETRAAFAQRVRSTFEIVVFDAGGELVARSTDGPMKAEQGYRVEPAGEGSRLTLTYDLEPPLMLRMFEGHFGPQITAELNSSLANLAQVLRGEEPAHGAWVWQPT